MVAILVLFTIIICLTIDSFVERAALRRRARAGPEKGFKPVSVRMPEDLTRVPAGIFVAPGHAWMELEPSGAVRVGADRLPFTLMDGAETIETPPVGTEVHQGEPVAVLRHGERTVEIKSPVDGVVAATNPLVAGNPARVGKEPFGAGWLVRMKPRNLGAALRRLFVAEEARTYLAGELSHLRDFLVGLSMAGRESLATATLPDGGLPVEGLAGRMPENEWRELTERFF